MLDVISIIRLEVLVSALLGNEILTCAKRLISMVETLRFVSFRVDQIVMPFSNTPNTITNE